MISDAGYNLGRAWNSNERAGKGGDGEDSAKNRGNEQTKAAGGSRRAKRIRGVGWGGGSESGGNGNSEECPPGGHKEGRDTAPVQQSRRRM